MTPELSRRLGSALGGHVVTPDERGTVVEAAKNVDAWAELPETVRLLVEEIEIRPGPGPATSEGMTIGIHR